jgi:hypothetical protein
MPDVTPEPVTTFSAVSTADFEIWAPDADAMLVGLKALGFWSDASSDVPEAEPDTGVLTSGVSPDGIAWSLNYYGVKPGAEGIFANLRWNGSPLKLANRPAGWAGTVRPMPADAPHQFS